MNHNAKSPKFFNQTKNIAIVVVVVVSRIEKNEPKSLAKISSFFSFGFCNFFQSFFLIFFLIIYDDVFFFFSFFFFNLLFSFLLMIKELDERPLSSRS